jgi:hypothetical protein
MMDLYAEPGWRRADGLWPTSKMVRMKAPERRLACPSVVRRPSCHSADRILELDESDAKPLLAAGWMRA